MAKNFFEDLTDEEFDRVNAIDASEIRKAAHIANGGDALFPCPACNGTGKWKNTYRTCYKCNGGGKVTKRVLGAAKAKITRENNVATFQREYAAEIAFVRENAEWSDFYRSLAAQVDDGRILSERQIASVQNGMAKAAAKREQRRLEKEAKSGEVDMGVIDRLFATAKSHGLKKPKWYAEGFVIETDRQYGCDDLWIKDENAGGYVGKLVKGQFKPFRRATEDTLPKLREIAADPLQAAIKYGQATNRCSCCGRGLRAGVSVVSAIGPICAVNWGLEGFREAAAELVAEEKARHK